jgi:hypothetical protein
MHVSVDKDLPRKPDGEDPKVDCPCRCKKTRAEKEPDDPDTAAATKLAVYYDING